MNDGTREKRRKKSREGDGADEEEAEPKSKRTRNWYVVDRTGVG